MVGDPAVWVLVFLLCSADSGGCLFKVCGVKGLPKSAVLVLLGKVFDGRSSFQRDQSQVENRCMWEKELSIIVLECHFKIEYFK